MYSLYKRISRGEEFDLEETDAKETLFQAAKNDDAPVILYLHNKGLINLDVTDDEGKTAVFYANKNKSTDALCELIQCDANFNLNDIDDDCAKDVLFKAAEMDRSYAIFRLHWQGLDLNRTDDEGKTAVFYANKNKSTDALCELIDDYAKFKLDDIDDDCAKDVLFKAAENDMDTAIMQLHWKGFDLNATDDEGNTAVFYANKNKSTDALCALIHGDANFKLDEIDDDCAKDVLFKAAEMDRDHAIFQLHWKGLDLDATDDQGNTAVFYANQNKSTDALCALIHGDANFNLNDIDDDCAKDVLFKAAEMDRDHAIFQLHWKGLDLDATDDQGNTAVFYANQNKSTDALCALIHGDANFNLNDIDDDCAKDVLFKAAEMDRSYAIFRLNWEGLDLNATDDEGKTAVFYANKNKSTYALCELINDDAKFKLDEIDDDCAKDVLFKAAEMDRDHAIWRLHSKGLDLNTTDDEGKTAVFYANKNKSTDALCELIHDDANFNLNDIDDDCAKDVLFKAAEMDRSYAIFRLHWEGLDLNATDDEGKTAVFYANKNKSINALCALIDANANFNLNDIDDDCAKDVLFKAAENDSGYAILRLHWEGLDLNTTDDEGKTAVFYANKNKSTYALCELIDRGAKFKLDEIDAKTVLFFACKNDMGSIIKPLYSAGLDLQQTDDERKTVVFH